MPKIELVNPNPYPEIVDATNNKEVVKLLYDLYANSESELGAILTYSYQHIVLKNTNAEVAELLGKIGIVEMHHIELLGNAIIKFGGLPYYINSANEHFSTKSVFYCTNILHILKNDILQERMAVQAYTKTAQIVQNASLKALLLRIAQDEELHIKALENAYHNQLKNQGDLDPTKLKNNFFTNAFEFNASNSNCKPFSSDINIDFDKQDSPKLSPKDAPQICPSMIFGE